MTIIRIPFVIPKRLIQKKGLETGLFPNHNDRPILPL